MEASAPKRLIPSIYTADGQVTTADTRHVKDYNQALAQALAYEAEGADEVIVMDVTSISERRRNLPKLVRDLRARLKIPFTFGGGVHSVRDVEDLLKYGAPRVYVNSAAVRYPDLVNTITNKHGKPALLVAIDTRFTFGSWKVYLNGGKSRTEMDLMNWISMMALRGAGELLISAINRGDVDQVIQLFKSIEKHAPLSIIGSSGFTTAEEYSRLINEGGIQGVVSAHFFQKEKALNELRALISSPVSTGSVSLD